MVGEWDVVQVAVHLAHAWFVVPNLARGNVAVIEDLLPERAGREDGPRLRDLADLNEMTIQAVRADPERDLNVLADRIETGAAAYFADCLQRSPDQQLAWMMQGVTFPAATFSAHLLNETVTHGYDIARAAGRPWPIKASTAVMIWERFLIRVAESTEPAALVDPVAGAGLRATYELRLRGGGRFDFRFDNGTLRVGPASGGPVDCRLSTDPVALLLVFWNRTNPWVAVARGQITFWGRKPWLAARFPALFLNP